VLKNTRKPIRSLVGKRNFTDYLMGGLVIERKVRRKHTSFGG
jgi:hypothetical protein